MATQPDSYWASSVTTDLPISILPNAGLLYIWNDTNHPETCLGNRWLDKSVCNRLAQPEDFDKSALIFNPDADAKPRQ